MLNASLTLPLQKLLQKPASILIFTLALLASLFATHPAQSAQANQDNVMVVLDASGSMWGQIDSVPKIEIARSVMSKVLTDLNGKANIGVLTYGHRKKGDCGDIETIIPIGQVNHPQYMSIINSLSPKGKTPITQAVRMAADEMRYTENKATIVLVSDGLETCQADPCALAKELESKGIDFTVHVVGFDLKGQDTSSLQCLAKETGGKYLAADNADELGDAVDTVVAEAPAPAPTPAPAPAPAPAPVEKLNPLTVSVLLSKASKPLKSGYVYIIPEADGKDRKRAVATGSLNRKHKVNPGKYYVEVQVERLKGSTKIEVKTNQKNHAEIILNAGLLSVDAFAAEGGKPIKQAYIYVNELEPDASGKRKQITGANQRKLFTLPAGKYFVVATHGKARAGQAVEIVAGKRTDTDIVLASGILKVSVLNKEGGKPQTRGAYVYIFESEKQTDGSRKQVTGANPRGQFTLPAGRYYVSAQIGKAKVGQEVDVPAGKRTEMSIVVGVGALKTTVIPAEGGKPLKKAYIEIYEKAKQLDGSRKHITSGNQRQIFKIPAGEYHIVAKLGKAKTTGSVNIKAGALTETTINLNAGALLIKASKKVYVEVYSAEKNLDGSRDHITSFRPGKSVMLPAGNYHVTGKQGKKLAEASAKITAGKLTEVSLEP